MGKIPSVTLPIANLFKSSLPSQAPVRIDFSTEPVNEVTADYLFHFCLEVLDSFLKQEGLEKEQLRATWYLTTPGY